MRVATRFSSHWNLRQANDANNRGRGAKGASSVARSKVGCALDCANTDPAHATVRRELRGKKASDACMLEGSIMHK